MKYEAANTDEFNDSNSIESLTQTSDPSNQLLEKSVSLWGGGNQ